MSTFEDIVRDRENPVIQVDHLGTIQSVNEPFTRVFGWTARELEGEPLTTILPPGLRDAHNLGFSRYLTTGESTVLGQSLDLRILLPDGLLAEAEHFIQVGDGPDGRARFAARIVPKQA